LPLLPSCKYLIYLLRKPIKDMIGDNTHRISKRRNHDNDIKMPKHLLAERTKTP